MVIFYVCCFGLKWSCLGVIGVVGVVGMGILVIRLFGIFEVLGREVCNLMLMLGLGGVRVGYLGKNRLFLLFFCVLVILFLL